MRTTVLLALLTSAIASAGCAKKITADMIEGSNAAMVEDNDQGSVAWVVGSDGSLQALLKSKDGTPISKPITGEITFKGSGDAKTVPVNAGGAGVITAAGPKLGEGLTEVDYALVADGKPWSGALDVPAGGTKELVESAKVQATLPAGKLGPHGGTVQIVGKDHVEVVGDKAGEVRVFVLGDDLKPVDPGERQITLAFVAETPQVLVLTPEPKGHYVVGKLSTKFDPVRVTVAVKVGGESHACIVGYAPGAHLVVVGSAAPRIKLFVVASWAEFDLGEGRRHHHGDHDDDDDEGKGDLHIKGGKGGGGNINIHIR